MYHYRFEREGDIYVNSGTEEEPRWTRLMDFGEGGINITTPEPPEFGGTPVKWDDVDLGPFTSSWSELVRSRDFGLADKVFYHFSRQAGKTAWLKAAPSVDENSYWYTTKEDTMQDKIRYVCDSIRDMLIDKNESYGNSALDPVRIFSDADPDEQLRTQIDHKLSRIQKGHDYENEDTILDLIGYLILLKIAQDG